jgi:peptidyl-prolyl cis-trans isomerase SurA
VNKVISQFICGLLFVSQFISLAEAKRPEIIELDHIVAVVNKDVITAEELRERQALITQQLEAKNTRMPTEAVLRKQVLEQMIMAKIQLQLAESTGIRVSDEQLNQIVERIAANNHMDLASFRQALENQGHDFASFREQIRNDLIIKQLRDRDVESKVVVSEQEIETELANLEKNKGRDTEYHLAHILIPVPESSRPDEVEKARQKAEGIVGQLRLGSDFSKMAISVSAGQRALQGGDLGWLKLGQIPAAATSIVQALQVNEISDPIRSSGGFHILKLLDKRDNTTQHIIEQTRARHILINTNQVTTDNQAQQKLIQIRKRILAGEDFATLAKATSDDPGSASLGGDLGWVNPGAMVPEFETEMKKLKPGEISQPFKTRFGWHIVQVISRRQHDDTEAYYKAQARQQLHERKLSEQTIIWLRRIRDEAYVEYRLDS